MNYIERTIRSAPGLSQEDALESLQTHPNFRSGTKIASLRRRGERWIAVLHVPKTAGEFPPSDDGGGSEEPKKPKDADGDSDGDLEESPGGPEGIGPEGPPAPGGEKKPGKGEGKGGGVEEQILHVLTEILHAVKGGPVGPGLGGPDDLGPGPEAMGGPPPHGGGLPMAGAPKPGAAGIGAKLKPGEVRNQPGVVPVGAPAFSSAHPLYQRLAKIAGHKRTIPVSSPAHLTIKQAQAELAPIAAHFGYKVAQITYCGPNCKCKAPGSNKIHALLEAN